MQYTYFPAGIPVGAADPTNIMSQLSSPFILLGDSHAKKVLWESVLTYETGRRVRSGSDVVFLNSDATMHISQGRGTSSALDL